MIELICSKLRIVWLKIKTSYWHLLGKLYDLYAEVLEHGGMELIFIFITGTVLIVIMRVYAGR